LLIRKNKFAMLKVENITKIYGTTKALDDISFSVKEGDMFGLLGPNGAGKTTLLRIITGISVPDSGRVYFNGNLSGGNYRSIIGYLPEERGLYPKLKVSEHISYFGQLKGVSQKDISKNLKFWLSRFEIAEYGNKFVGDLSKGNQQKVQIICALIHTPRLLIMDEPLSGFDPINANIFNDVISELSAGGTTIIFSSHNMASVESICNNMILIDKGNKLLDGNIKEIKQKYKQNEYEIILSSPVDKADIGPGLSICGYKTDSGCHIYRIRKNGDISNNEILDIMTRENNEILYFTEVLPTLNSIFIRCINNHE
jgi:hypothetical protein